jgi:hypothetical protein
MTETVYAEVVSETETPRGGDPNRKRPMVAEVPHRAANALDAVADTVAHVSREGAEKIRHKAQTVRAIGESAEVASHATGKFVDSIKETADKLGLKFTMENRVPTRKR